MGISRRPVKYRKNQVKVPLNLYANWCSVLDILIGILARQVWAFLRRKILYKSAIPCQPSDNRFLKKVLHHKLHFYQEARRYCLQWDFLFTSCFSHKNDGQNVFNKRFLNCHILLGPLYRLQKVITWRIAFILIGWWRFKVWWKKLGRSSWIFFQSFSNFHCPVTCQK